ncbi:MAG TPA: DUF4446 family protein [Selenomonadales bacterium]|nr:DUF4446 family protein [Selenomonadales bacterium]
MDVIGQITPWLMENIQYVIIALTAAIFLALIVFISINLKLAKLNRRYEKMMQGANGANLEELLQKHIEEVRQATDKVSRLDRDCQRLDGTLRTCVQKVGLVRFNAFEDTGSDLSFAMALLDAGNNGVVLSSIFGRSESRIYAKPVVAGVSSYFLTDEEKEALAQAQETNSKK